MSYVRLPDDATLRRLVAEFGTFSAVARELGCSKTQVATRCRAMGLASPDRRGGSRSCDVCGVVAYPKRPILRFSLQHHRRHLGGRGAGTVYLCEPCWKRAGERRRKVA